MTPKFNLDGHKMQYHLDRVRHWQLAKSIEEKLQVFPIYVEVSPVGHCNHRCTFCALDYLGYNPNLLDPMILGTAIEDMADHGVRSIMFGGEGEPLLHPDIANLITYTKAKGIDVALTTNGTRLTEDFIGQCLPHLTWLKVSLNAGTALTYKSIHKGKESDYWNVWQNITTACLSRDMKKLKTTIGIQCIVLPENVGEVETLAVDAAASGVDYLVLKPYSQHLSSPKTAERYSSIRYQDYDEYLTKLAAIHSVNGFQLIYRRETALSECKLYNTCLSVPYFWAYIMSNGDVYGCSAFLLNERFKYGNINQSSFSEIWTGQARREAIDFVEHHLDISDCRMNCRMEKVNCYLWDLAHPSEHRNFI